MAFDPAQVVPIGWSRIHPTRAGWEVGDPMKREKLSIATRWRILSRDHFRCMYCGATPFDARLEIDHYVPVSRGGGDDDWNLITACRSCNAGKADQGCPRPMCGGRYSPRDSTEAACRCDCHECGYCDITGCPGGEDMGKCPVLSAAEAAAAHGDRGGAS